MLLIAQILMLQSKLRWSLILALSTLPYLVWAEDSQSVYFAKQAGVITGAAEACGQPVSMMIMRSGEIIDALATDSMDKSYATAAFSKAQQDAHTNMVNSQQISCAKVITDFNSLPLLQPDYKQTVLQPLLAASPGANLTKTKTALPTPVNPAIPSPSLPTETAPATSAENTNPLASQTSPPTQNYVAGSTNTNNPATIPPINMPQNSNAATQAQNGAQQNTEMARLQLAQQLAQLAQTLATNNSQSQLSIGAGQPSINNPAYNPALNNTLYGVGANNPIFTGAPLGKAPPTTNTSETH